LQNLGGDQRYTLDGVITLYPAIEQKAWVLAKDRDKAVEYFREEGLLNVISPNYQSVGAWARDILSRDEELPDWVQTSEGVVLRHRSH